MRNLLWLSLVTFASVSLGCASNCEDLRTKASELKNELGSCTAGDTCVVVTVSNDCVGGALACGFAVPSAKVDEARRRAQEIADTSQSCEQCAQAECVARGQPTCDPTAGRCV